MEVKKNGATIAQFTCDGDGKRVKSVINGETTLFVGNYFEQKGAQFTKYYFAGAARIALRKYTIPQNMTAEYLISTGSIQRLGDHPSASLRASLGSTSLTTDADGAKVSEMRYKPWGEVRYTWTNAPANTSPAYELVKYQFTGQYSYDVEFGLLLYNARWYDPSLGRFTQADTIVPTSTQGVQAWDRYAYANNNPVRYNDPTGHCPMCISAAVDAAIGFGFSYVTQAIANKKAGMELSDALNINNMNKGELIIATVGGAVAGATMGLAAPALAGAMTSELGAYMIAGALSNAAAGIAESTTQAYIEQSLDGSPSWGLDNEGFNEFTTDVYNAGLTPGNVAYDLASGAVLSAGSYAIVRPLTGPIRRIPNAMFFDDIYFESQGYLVGPSAETVKIIADTGQQMLQDFIGRRLERKLEMLAQ